MRIAGAAEVRIDPSCRLRASVRPQARTQATVQPGFGESNRLRGAAVVARPATRIRLRGRKGEIVSAPMTTAHRSGDSRETLRRPERSSFGGAQGAPLSLGGRRGHSPPAGEIEGNVAALIHDLTDDNNEGGDEVSYDIEDIITVFKTCRNSHGKRDDTTDFVWCMENWVDPTVHRERFPRHEGPPTNARSTRPSGWGRRRHPLDMATECRVEGSDTIRRRSPLAPCLDLSRGRGCGGWPAQECGC